MKDMKKSKEYWENQLSIAQANLAEQGVLVDLDGSGEPHRLTPLPIGQTYEGIDAQARDRIRLCEEKIKEFDLNND